MLLNRENANAGADSNPVWGQARCRLAGWLPARCPAYLIALEAWARVENSLALQHPNFRARQKELRVQVHVWKQETKTAASYLRLWFCISYHFKKDSLLPVFSPRFSWQGLTKLSFVTFGRELRITMYCPLFCTIQSNALLKKNERP